MILGIDASNIKAGGGLTHLKEILNAANPMVNGFEKVIVWSNNETLQKLPDVAWLEKISHPYLNKSFLWCFFFQLFYLSKEAKKHNCKIMFVPGGTFLGTFKPFVTMSQNMLPFEMKEAFRFKSWTTRLRFVLLFITQSLTFKRAGGIIFLTNYAENAITNKIKLKNKRKIIIPHGINRSFSNEPKKQLSINEYSSEKPYQLLYVSIVTAYKHQWNVAKAVLDLQQEGLPVSLHLIGPGTEESLSKLRPILESEQNKNGVVKYLGAIDHEKLSDSYKKADAFVFASSCENMPIILIEAMTSGLPIASSDRGPMPEVLGNAGLYFDPTDSKSIYECLKKMLLNENERSNIADMAYSKTKDYTWENCSNATFKFLSQFV